MAKFEQAKSVNLRGEYFKNREFSPINANKYAFNHTNVVISLLLHENYPMFWEAHLTHNIGLQNFVMCQAK